METTDAEDKVSTTQAFQLLDWSESALKADSFNEFAVSALPGIAEMMRSPSALLYVSDPRLTAPEFFQHGAWQQYALEVERWCVEYFERISGQSDLQPILQSIPSIWGVSGELMLYPLLAEKGCHGMLGLVTGDRRDRFPSDMVEKLLQLIGIAVQRLAEHAKNERQLAQLNSYLTVSSMLAQSQSLHEELEVALYCCMELVTAETASVLLLDDEKSNFRFYHVEGPTKPILETALFPADRGLAGAVLQSQHSEVINDVSDDPRFFEQIDTESGFQTRNMIIIPLTAGEERVGVLEVLNKADDKDFTEDDRLLLLSIAEEIAFAIRNAKVFEYVVNSYCKQRQGESCKGCQRPLGSWTPCVKYREAML
ncbi:GAF domain-containing protein [candidate division KSB1 bacterium]|nr:GAF domain-containing protein [candidate division KSB1 bacterium]